MNGQKQQAKQKQTLQFTPQLQKSLQILQTSQQDLELVVSEMLANNIMLTTSADNDLFGDVLDTTAADQDESFKDDEIPDHIDADFDWEIVYDSEADIPSEKHYEDFDDSFYSSNVSFDEALEKSIYLAFQKKSELLLAQTVLENLDDNYFLTLSVEKIAKQNSLSLEDLKAVIEKIKHLNPGGVASQSIQECLLAKLHLLPNYSDDIGNAHDILTDYFPYIGHKPQMIMKRLNLSDGQYKKAQEVIRQLSPYPCEESIVASNNMIKADIYIHQRMGIYYASINEDARFDILINKDYEILAKQCSKDELHFVTSQLQEAKSFIKSLEQRNNTILRVANVIVLHQQKYFQLGDAEMKSLSMQEVAELLKLHESTISRAVNNKYLSFNHQLIELKYFFSKQLLSESNDSKLEGGKGVSTHQIKTKISEMINNEDQQSPLSDTKIAVILKKYDIDIARRTVAKYREELGFEKTSKRKIKI